ncbi:MAG: hypothetical protein HQL77_00790 [Magnetococcales bacterium]|nr:hypothetical protein [Magnetococcales bacterium]
MIYLNSANARPLTDKEKAGARLSTLAVGVHFVLIMFFVLFKEYSDISPIWFEYSEFFSYAKLIFSNASDFYSYALRQIYPLAYIFGFVHIIIAWFFFVDDLETRLASMKIDKAPLPIIILFISLFVYVDYAINYRKGHGYSFFHNLMYSSVYGILFMQLHFVVCFDSLFKIIVSWVKYMRTHRKARK